MLLDGIQILTMTICRNFNIMKTYKYFVQVKFKVIINVIQS